jgi:hypothetical protein
VPETSTTFVTGVCDGLMAAHPQTPVDPLVWQDLPEAARLDGAIVFADDAWLNHIEAERLHPDDSARYELTIETSVP